MLSVRRLAWPNLRELALGLSLGVALGALLAVAVVGALALGGGYDVRGVRWNGPYLALGLARQAVASVLEALVFGLLVGGALLRLVPPGVALVLAALIFGSAHAWNPHATVGTCLSVACVVGLPFLTLLTVTRNFWAAGGVHWAWNAALGPVFGVVVAGYERWGVLDAAVSGPALWTGGAYGPEASLTAVVAAALLSGICLRSSVLRRWGRPNELGRPSLPPS